MSTSPTDPPESKPAEADPAVVLGQAVLTGLVAIIILAASYTFFVWRKNNEMSQQLIVMAEQKKNAREFENFYQSFILDLSGYGQQHPEILEMLIKQGLQVRQNSLSAGEPPPLPPPPAP